MVSIFDFGFLLFSCQYILIELINFCVLVFHSVTLLDSLISSKNFLGRFLGIFYIANNIICE